MLAARSCSSAAHPRSRGEHLCGQNGFKGGVGSPPLARGTQPRPSNPALRQRLTPARAGNTSTPRISSSCRSAHPRSRGEHFFLLSKAVKRFGSPPLARGTHSLTTDEVETARLTPARAGNTLRPASSGGCVPAHPRSRGEHFRQIGVYTGEGGSPPLARGTLPSPARQSPQERLTPARAGNTAGIECYTTNTTAHPRSRGEHCDYAGARLRSFGSPPLARGTLAEITRRPNELRLTPARAGNTVASVVCKSPWTAHPRSRGEHSHLSAYPAYPAGSPPLARGTPCNYARNCGIFRLTPARAGNTGLRSPGPSGQSAHPRSRGEHVAPNSSRQIRSGSPPLARGTRLIK